ncbi:hypothetical protein R5R35_002394 [Gryllus longicercus]|uniref:Uncharacterized protein n=1 Tax=Gryllus longicercus TaxID=2509291 RepID=A0AAN9V817_9ORTH
MYLDFNPSSLLQGIIGLIFDVLQGHSLNLAGPWSTLSSRIYSYSADGPLRKRLLVESAAAPPGQGPSREGRRARTALPPPGRLLRVAAPKRR